MYELVAFKIHTQNKQGAAYQQSNQKWEVMEIVAAIS